MVARKETRLAYAGMSNMGTTDCRQLTFNFAGMAWRLWIEAGEKPVPRRLIALGGSDGRHYVATFDRWDFDPAMLPNEFDFVPPQGAEKIDIVPLNPDVSADAAASAAETK
jgi:hypothetical protein